MGFYIVLTIFFCRFQIKYCHFYRELTFFPIYHKINLLFYYKLCGKDVFSMKTIGLIGLGLIGGSIAKAIRKYHPDYHILAFDQNRGTLAAAVSGNIIDGVCEEKDNRFGSCDYVFLCARVFDTCILETL